ncbi:MAG TPA: cytochrome C [Thermoanaerobaculia bacterium]|nr:cytochrome C [Thermoanaerobaculia bacterium]
MRGKSLAAAAVLTLLLVPLSGSSEAQSSDEARIQQGFRIAPVPLKFRKNVRDLVGLGSYIVNAQAGCNDCHTNPPYAEGGNPFEGEPEQINAEHYLAGGTAFGPFISANITPDSSGRPHGLTFQEFLEVMHTGHDPDDGGILQVMPWPVYGKMTRRDLRAVYEYLSAIPHAEPVE